MLTSDNWKDYMLIDASDGQKLEKWGDYYLVRPDPQAIWQCRTEKKIMDIRRCRIPQEQIGRRSVAVSHTTSQKLAD